MVTTEMLVKVVIRPSEFEVMAVSVIVLVLAREEEDVVDDLLVEVVVVLGSSELELVASMID